MCYLSSFYRIRFPQARISKAPIYLRFDNIARFNKPSAHHLQMYGADELSVILSTTYTSTPLVGCALSV